MKREMRNENKKVEDYDQSGAERRRRLWIVVGPNRITNNVVLKL